MKEHALSWSIEMHVLVPGKKSKPWLKFNQFSLMNASSKTISLIQDHYFHNLPHRPRQANYNELKSRYTMFIRIVQ